METTPITIAVDSAAAQIYAAATPAEQWKMQVLLSLRLQDITAEPSRPLREVIDEMSRRAAERGLTPEILESILRGEDE